MAATCSVGWAVRPADERQEIAVPADGCLQLRGECTFPELRVSPLTRSGATAELLLALAHVMIT